MIRIARLTILGLLTLTAAPIASAQDATAPSDLPLLADKPDSADPLGPIFSSDAAGITFRPPAGGKLIRRPVPDEIVQYVNEEASWMMTVTRTQLQDAIPLREYRDPNGQTRPGMLDLTLDRFKRQQPGADVLRKNFVTVGRTEAGLLTLRYAVGATPKLSQQAIFQSNDRIHYTFTMISPGARDPKSGDDPAERRAVEVFRKMIDTVKILDRAEIKRDQDERLYRTRSLFVNWTPDRIKAAMVPQQWLRLMRDGKDIGYTYIVEEPDKDRPDGIMIGLRSRTTPESGVRVDAESWLGTTLDRRHEVWTNAVVVERDGKQDYTTEFGVSNVATERVLDPTLRGGTPDDAGQPPVRKHDSYTLEVTYIAKSAAHPPVKRDLPVFYIPQAVGQMLPKLLPLGEPKGYLFAVWVSDQHEIMARYVDVEPARDMGWAGKKQTVIPIRDRIGLEGSPTWHYMSIDGEYLGSENKDSKIVILPADEPTLRKIWSNADLTRPSAMPAPAAK